ALTIVKHHRGPLSQRQVVDGLPEQLRLFIDLQPVGSFRIAVWSTASRYLLRSLVPSLFPTLPGTMPQPGERLTRRPCIRRKGVSPPGSEYDRNGLLHTRDPSPPRRGTAAWRER